MIVVDNQIVVVPLVEKLHKKLFFQKSCASPPVLSSGKIFLRTAPESRVVLASLEDVEERFISNSELEIKS